jgi:hypothetical protein
LVAILAKPSGSDTYGTVRVIGGRAHRDQTLQLDQVAWKDRNVWNYLTDSNFLIDCNGVYKIVSPTRVKPCISGKYNAADRWIRCHDHDTSTIST